MACAASRSLYNLNNKLHRRLVIKDRNKDDKDDKDDIVIENENDIFDEITQFLMIQNEINFANILKIRSNFNNAEIVTFDKDLNINAKHKKVIIHGKTFVVNSDFKINGNSTILKSKETHLMTNVLKIGSSTSLCSTIDEFRGIQFLWNKNANNKCGFFGFNKNNERFIFIPNVEQSNNNIFLGHIGNAEFNKIYISELLADNNLIIKSKNIEIESKCIKFVTDKLYLKCANTNNSVKFNQNQLIISTDKTHFFSDMQVDGISTFSLGIVVSGLGQFINDVIINNILTVCKSIVTDNIVSRTNTITIGQSDPNETINLNGNVYISNKLSVDHISCTQNNEHQKIEMDNDLSINGNLEINKLVKISKKSIKYLTNGTDITLSIDDLKRIYIIKDNSKSFTITLPNENTHLNEGLLTTFKNLTSGTITIQGFCPNDIISPLNQGQSITCMSIDDSGSLVWISL